MSSLNTPDSVSLTYEEITKAVTEYLKTKDPKFVDEEFELNFRANGYATENINCFVNII